jgi:hypothetical protein
MRSFQTLVVFGLALAVILVLAKVIWGSPLVKHVREGFASRNAAAPINTMTECPPGSTMYMYDGVAYCCGGQIAVDANEVMGSCRPATSAPNAPAPLFCSLGPASTDTGIPNCVESRAGLMQALGEQICPTSMPNAVITEQETKCCASLANANYTDCMDNTQPSCPVIVDSVWLREPGSCQWIKDHEENGACPQQMAPIVTSGGGTMSDLTLYGCLDHGAGQVCYSQALVNTLKGMGYDSSAMTVCSST